METKNFIEKIEEVKRKNKLDISLDQDLAIALMNLVSLEEHSFFSYIKTENEEFLETLEKTRELRKKLLKFIVKEDESEKWCMSKHFLASSMRLYEVGNRLLHEKKKKEASEMYKEAGELFGMFWKLNKKHSNAKKNEVKNKKQEKSVFKSIKKMLECCKE